MYNSYFNNHILDPKRAKLDEEAPEMEEEMQEEVEEENLNESDQSNSSNQSSDEINDFSRLVKKELGKQPDNIVAAYTEILQKKTDNDFSEIKSLVEDRAKEGSKLEGDKSKEFNAETVKLIEDKVSFIFNPRTEMFMKVKTS